MSDHALFVIAPCVSFVAFVVAATLRALHHNSVSVPPPPLAGRRGAGIRLLPAIGFLGVLLGHAVMIAWPDQLLKWNRNLSRLMALELALFALGAAALVGAAAAIGRRVLRRTDGGASFVDAAFLGVLLLALVSGLGIAVVYRWASVWSAVTLTHYARSLLSFQPNVGPLEAMPYLVKLHLFSGFIVVALLPFTPLFDVWLNALFRTTNVVMGPFVSAFDRQGRMLRKWALRSGQRLVWPEDED